MGFLKRRLPLLLCVGTGIVFFLQYYVPHPLSQRLLSEASTWVAIVGAFAVLLGLASVLKTHVGRLASVRAGWGYSLVLLMAMAGMTVLGTSCRFQDADPVSGRVTGLGWAYTYVLSPLNATVFATLGFYVASAAVRTFRLKSLEAGLLMATALILVFGRVPLAEALWSRLTTHYDPRQAASIPHSLNSVTEWIVGVPTLAAQRGILFGVALGSLVTALKVILGLDRPYLGMGDKGKD